MTRGEFPPPIGDNGRVEPENEIMCIDCGGRSHLLTPPREDNVWEVGDVLAYRCEDCLDRWDIVLEEDDFEDVERGDDHREL